MSVTRSAGGRRSGLDLALAVIATAQRAHGQRPFAPCSPTTSSKYAPTAKDEAGEPFSFTGRTGPETSPAARSSWSTSPKSRSVSAWPSRAHSTRSPGTPARHRRASDVFPIPGSPSKATSHGDRVETTKRTPIGVAVGLIGVALYVFVGLYAISILSLLRHVNKALLFSLHGLIFLCRILHRWLLPDTYTCSI
jgi:hypothetical protein